MEDRVCYSDIDLDEQGRERGKWTDISMEGAEFVGPGIRGAGSLVFIAILCNSNQEKDVQMCNTRKGNTIVHAHIWLKSVGGKNWVRVVAVFVKTLLVDKHMIAQC